jgi:hypothetical protein
MKIYMIEDNPLKAENVLVYINDILENVEVYIFESFQSGLKAILKEMPDLIVLDMTIPTFDRSGGDREGRLRPLGGMDLMKKLALRDLDFKAIVVTQLETFGEGDGKRTFEEINALCKSEFKGMYLGGFQYLQGSNNWKQGLSEVLQHTSEE